MHFVTYDFSSSHMWMWQLDHEESAKELMLLNCGIEKDSWEFLGLQGEQTSQSERKSVLTSHWNNWCWSLNSSTLATWKEELTHLKRPWCWERLKAGRERDGRGWDSWMASLTWWTWANSRNCWWTGKSGVLQSMGSQRVRHDWGTEQQQQLWIDLINFNQFFAIFFIQNIQCL